MRATPAAADPAPSLRTLPGVARAAKGYGLWVVLVLGVLAVIGSVAYRAYQARARLKAAVAAAELALARDTYGGFRDTDRALRDFVTPRSTRTKMIAMRSYALAQLAARYGDNQAAVDSELLNAPLQRSDEGHRGVLPPSSTPRGLCSFWPTGSRDPRC